MTSALVLSRSFPSSAERVHGIYQRLGTLVEALARVVNDVNCLFLVPRDQESEVRNVQQHEERLRHLWSRAVSIKLAAVVIDDPPRTRWQRFGTGVFDFHAQQIARPTSSGVVIDAVNAALDVRPDILLAHRLTAMYPLIRIARRTPERIRGIPLYFDLDDIEHVSLARRLMRNPAWPAERLLLLQLPALMWAEIRAMRLATSTLVCSEADRRFIARLNSSGRTETVPNSVNFPNLDDVDASEPLVLFVGTLGYRPNVQAADLLVRQIWPRVRARVPEARLAIIGPGREFAASCPAADHTITFTGFVDDLASWYRRARVVCCPIYHGAGTRIKIIEAAAYAKAVVTTPVGAEGLNFDNGREIILRNSVLELAGECVRLLNDRHAAALLGQAALRKASSIYDKRAVLNQLADIFGTSLSEAARNRTPG